MRIKEELSVKLDFETIERIIFLLFSPSVMGKSDGERRIFSTSGETINNSNRTGNRASDIFFYLFIYSGEFDTRKLIHIE